MAPWRPSPRSSRYRQRRWSRSPTFPRPRRPTPTTLLTATSTKAIRGRRSRARAVVDSGRRLVENGQCRAGKRGNSPQFGSSPTRHVTCSGSLGPSGPRRKPMPTEMVPADHARSERLQPRSTDVVQFVRQVVRRRSNNNIYMFVDQDGTARPVVLRDQRGGRRPPAAPKIPSLTASVIRGEYLRHPDQFLFLRRIGLQIPPGNVTPTRPQSPRPTRSDRQKKSSFPQYSLARRNRRGIAWELGKCTGLFALGLFHEHDSGDRPLGSLRPTTGRIGPSPRTPRGFT